MGEDADNDCHTIEKINNEWFFDPGDTNGVDDDNNGFVDDFIGWHFDYDSSCVNDDNNPKPPRASSWASHGTHCIGIACATTDNCIGVAGLSHNCKFLPIQINYDSGSYLYDQACALLYAASFDDKVSGNVISCSWATYYTDDEDIYDAIDSIYNYNESIMVFSAGNMHIDSIKYPAKYDETIAVGATNCQDNLIKYSCFGNKLDIVAPGHKIWSTYDSSSYYSTWGTSMASPHAAATAALLLSIDSSFTQEDIRTILRNTADTVGTKYYYSEIDSIFNINYGNDKRSIIMGTGRLNSLKALIEACPSHYTVSATISYDTLEYKAKDYIRANNK